MIAATYHRCSTTDQNPALAREELRHAAERMGARLELEIEETGSGANNDRPGLQKILAAARKRKIDVVVVYKLDRFGRSALDLLANIRELESAGVRFVCTSQGIDIRPGGDPMGRLLLTMLAAVAEFERDLIRERTRLGLARARKRGKRLGRPKISLPSGEKVRELLGAGKNWMQIARELGTSRYAVKQAVGGVR